MRLVLSTLGVLLLQGCRVPCDADGTPSPSQLAREQKAMYRGQPICRALLAPDVTVTADRIVLRAVKENVVGDAELGPRLAQYRDHFRIVRAGEPYDATITFHLDPGLLAARVVPLLAAAADAGLPRMHLEAGGAHADLTVTKSAPLLVPGLTAGDLVGGAAPGRSVRLR